VHDVATLREKLERSEEAVRTLTETAREREHRNDQLVRQISRLRERLAEIAMAASISPVGKERRKASSEPIAFAWALQQDGPRARLELQTAASGDHPTRVRIMDRQGQVVAACAVALLSLDGKCEFQVEPPLDLIADLEAGREIGYEVETLVGGEWRLVRLSDSGRRKMSVVDPNGRVLRVSETHDALPAASSQHRRSTLN
jgi:hypothetical protein